MGRTGFHHPDAPATNFTNKTNRTQIRTLQIQIITHLPKIPTNPPQTGQMIDPPYLFVQNFRMAESPFWTFEAPWRPNAMR